MRPCWVGSSGSPSWAPATAGTMGQCGITSSKTVLVFLNLIFWVSGASGRGRVRGQRRGTEGSGGGRGLRQRGGESPARRPLREVPSQARTKASDVGGFRRPQHSGLRARLAPAWAPRGGSGPSIRFSPWSDPLETGYSPKGQSPLSLSAGAPGSSQAAPSSEACEQKVHICRDAPNSG